MKQIYLDYAAATPVDSVVLDAMQPYFAETFYNPSAVYAPAKAVRRDVTEARARVAQVLGVKPGEILFTAGGTEANNLAIAGIMERFPDASCLISAVEHDSVRAVAKRYKHQTVSVKPSGHLLMNDLVEKISDDTVLISVTYANNEIGTIQSLSEIAKVVHEIRQHRKEHNIELPLYLHTDACQAGNYLDLHAHSLGVDLMTLNGGKIYGPKQSGCLYVHRSIELEPIIYGGGQEQGIRSGTENVAFMIGFARALERTQQNRASEHERLRSIQEYFFAEIMQEGSTVEINGTRENRLANNLNITIPGRLNERLLLELEQKGILAAAGSACSAQKKQEASPTLQAIGRSTEEAHQSIRFTMGRATTKEDITTLLNALRDLLY